MDGQTIGTGPCPLWVAPDRKIDYIFTEGAVKANTCRIVPGVLSDHLPLEAVMEIWPLNFPT